MASDKVRHMFASLEIEVHEVLSLFHLLEDDGDGVVLYEEFLHGIMRLKGQARALDVVAISRDCENIMVKQCEIERSMAKIEEICTRNAATLSCVTARRPNAKPMTSGDGNALNGVTK